MLFREAITVFVVRIFARRVIDGLVLIAPFVQAGISVVFVGVEQAAELNHVRQSGLIVPCCTLGSIRITTSPSRCSKPNTGRFLNCQRAAPALAFQPPPSVTAQCRDNVGVSLIPRNHRDFIGFKFAAQAHGLF